MKLEGMAEDTRTIECLFREDFMFRVGDEGITSIVVYQETGEISFINYAAIYKGEFLWRRTDLRSWTIQYKEE